MLLLRKARLSLLAILALVALRFVIGFHFYMEGYTKVKEGNFSSTGFLAAAKGPLADKFQQLIPDFEGIQRLPTMRAPSDDPDVKYPKTDPDPKLTYEKLFGKLDKFVEEATALYAFNEEQAIAAKAELAEAKEKLINSLSDWRPQILEYLQGFDRIERNKKDEMRNNVSSMRKQKDEIETKWKALVKPALAEVDSVLASLESAVNKLATEEQIGTGKDKRVAKFVLDGAGPIDVKLVDKYLPIFDMSVGILLMIGLLTPIAALAAGLFLASVVLTQFPGYPGTQPTYYQAIEMIGCFVLAFADAGRYAGLDFLPWSFWNRGGPKDEE